MRTVADLLAYVLEHDVPLGTALVITDHAGPNVTSFGLTHANADGKLVRALRIASLPVAYPQDEADPGG